MIRIVLFVIGGLLIAWGLLYHFLHVRDSYEDQGPIGLLNATRFKGLGLSLNGGFRTKNPGIKVHYALFSLLIFPIYISKAVIVDYNKPEDLYDRDGYLNSDMSRKTNINWLEALSIFAFYYGILIVIAGTFFNA